VTWSVIGRGSYFAGAPAPKDVDLVVVTDELLERGQVLERLEPVLATLPLDELRLDLAVVRPADFTTWHRAIVAEGVHLAGVDLRPHVAPVTWPEWAFFAAWWWQSELARDRPAAALAAVRGLLAPTHGPLILSKALAPPAAAGTEWEDLAVAAWSYRGDPAAFDHPDLERAGRACLALAAGEPTTIDGRTILVVYRAALPDELVAAALRTGPAEFTAYRGGWTKTVSSDLAASAALWSLAQVAHACWFDGNLAGVEPLELHRHPTGSTFPIHVDREEHFDEAYLRRFYPDANLELLRTRSANLVAMIRPAGEGGHLRLWPNPDGPPISPELATGDVAIFDGRIAHEVTRVQTGERLVLVTHLHDGP